MPKCKHGLTSKECYVCASPKYAAPVQEPVAWTSGIPPLYPEMKDGETISAEYVEATPPAAYPEFECPRCGHCCSHSSIVSGS